MSQTPKPKRSLLSQFITSILRIIAVVGVILLLVWLYIAQPSFKQGSTEEIGVNEQRMIQTVRTLSEDYHPRTFRNSQNLEATARYIEQHFELSGGKVILQPFDVSGDSYENIRCQFGNAEAAKLIIGAHYDAHHGTPGADDNASGVAGLIELAYLLGAKKDLPICIELVAYTLEEPPFFGSQKMGSYFHAEMISKSEQPIIGVIAIEMIGYFSDTFGSQDYPALLFKFLYPNTGNFIAIIGKLDQRAFTKTVKIGMLDGTKLPIRSVNAPSQVPGIDFSDHRNYWPFGHQAVMITDTAFYRNKAYHKPDDTWDRLDYDRMAEVIKGIYFTTLHLAERHSDTESPL